MAATNDVFQRAQAATSSAEAVPLFEQVLASENGPIKQKEAALQALAKLYAEVGEVQKLASLLENAKPIFAEMPKARTGKLVRTIIVHVAAVPNTLELQEKLCKDCIAWAESQKRRFLRQRLDARLTAIQLQQGKYEEAIRGIEVLMSEVKKLDDKQLLVELHLVESQIHHKVRNDCHYVHLKCGDPNILKLASSAVLVAQSSQSKGRVDCCPGKRKRNLFDNSVAIPN